MAKSHPRTVYFIDRGERPGHHQAPYHRYLVCPSRPVALWEADWSGRGAWVWSHANRGSGSGWLLLRWNGLDVDYGSLVRGFALPDGTVAGFAHPGTGKPPWSLLEHAVWWSTLPVPAWLVKLGVSEVADTFSRDAIARGWGDRAGDAWKRQPLFPGEEVGALSDWLEEHGHADAAAAMRRAFRLGEAAAASPEVAPARGLFAEGGAGE